MKKKPKLDSDGKPMMGSDGKPMMEEAAAEDKKGSEEAEKAARETAAFKGGADPGTSGSGSTFMQLMAARRAG